MSLSRENPSPHPNPLPKGEGTGQICEPEIAGEAHTLPPLPSGEAHTLPPLPSGEAHTLPPLPSGEAHTLPPLPSGEGRGEGQRKRQRTTTIARTLRRNQTEAEKIFWRAVRSRQLGGWKFRRQFPIAGHIADFACMELKLVVEIDGGQHTAEKDAPRNMRIESEGYLICRFWNNEIMQNLQGVLEALTLTLSLREKALETQRG